MLGAMQKAMMAPRGIANGDLTDISGPVLLVGFKGWRDFNPELAAGNLCEQGIDARARSGSICRMRAADLGYVAQRYRAPV